MLGLVAARLDLFDLAERAYREALRLDPRLAEAGHDVGVIRLEQRRWSEALEHVAEAVTVSPSRIDSPSDPRVRAAPSGALRRGWSLVAAVLVAFAGVGERRVLPRPGRCSPRSPAGSSSGSSAARLPSLTRSACPPCSARPTLALAVYAVAAAPLLILLYALVGTPWLLVLAIVATAVAELAVIRRTGPRHERRAAPSTVDASVADRQGSPVARPAWTSLTDRAGGSELRRLRRAQVQA